MVDIPARLATAYVIEGNLPIASRIRFNFDLRLFVDNNGLSFNVSTYICYGMMFHAHVNYGAKLPISQTVEKTDFRPDFKDAVFSNVDSGDKAKFTVVNDMKKAIHPDFGNDQIELFEQILKKSELYLVDLVASDQADGLYDRNVDSYFKMHKADIATERIVQIVRFLSRRIDKIYDEPSTTLRSQRVAWLRYRLTYASTPALVKKMIEELGDSIIVSADTIAKIKAALDAPYSPELSDKIPTKIRAMCYIYLDVTRQLPDNWYQGIRANDEVSTFWKLRIRAYFNKIVALKAKITDIDAGTNEAELKAAIGNPDLSV